MSPELYLAYLLACIVIIIVPGPTVTLKRPVTLEGLRLLIWKDPASVGASVHSNNQWEPGSAFVRLH